MKIAITGGTGFIGKHLAKHLIDLQHEVFIISRSTKIIEGLQRAHQLTWNQLHQKTNLLEGLDAIVNLAGETIDQRWTDDSKNRILHSRLDATHEVARLIGRLLTKPKVLIQGSAIGIYGTSDTESFDESSSTEKNDFLSDVVTEWEHTAEQINVNRIVKLRTGVVLGLKGGALPKMMLPYKLGVGGRIGHGHQWISWIHINDIVEMILYCIEHEEVRGAVNATAPNPVTNDQFGRAIGRVVGRPHWLPVPASALRLLLGTMSDLVLKGQKVMPTSILQHGFEFTYNTVEEALSDIVK